MRRISIRPLSGPWVMAILVFLITAAGAALITTRLEQDRRRMEYAHVSSHAGDYAYAIQRHIERALSATYALAALVRQGDGVVTDFEATAREMLSLYPGLSSLQLAPGGVVQQIVPLAGNEKALGYDLLQNPARSKEARLARDTGQLTLAGPFDLIQGGLGAAGRLPVFLNDRAGSPTFWGFTIVLLRFPEALAPVKLSGLVDLGFHYELWRIHPDTGQKQIIAAATSAPLIAPINQIVEVPNATWTLSVSPVNGWSRPLRLASQAGLGLLLSLLMAWLAKLLIELHTHKQRLEALAAEVKTREADLNHAQSVARIGSWTLDLIRNDVRWSAETYRLFGVPPGVAMDYPRFLESVHPDDHARVDQAWRAALNGAPYDIEHRIVVDGAIRWVHEQAQIEFAGDGTPQCCIGTVQDITERKAAEEALQAREQHYRLLIQHLHAGVVVHAPDTRILLANEQAVRMLGLSMAQMLGKTALDPAWAFVSENQARMPLDEYPVNRVLATRQPLRNLVLGIRHSGVKDQVWVLVNAFPESDAQGELRQIVVTFIDITEQRQSEAQLRESEAHYRLLFEAANDGIVFHAMQSDQSPGGFIQVNPVICRLLGYSADEMRRLTPLDIQEAEDLASVPQEAQALHDRGFLLFEKTLIGKDGRRIPVEIHATAFQSGGQPVVVSIIRDITERKRMEAALQAMATTDDLTGLANRRCFLACLDEELARLQRDGTQRAAVLMLDLDHFKQINDAFGHAAGDVALRHCAALLRDSLRKFDKVGRLGGEEFAILLSGADLAAAQGFAERLRQKIAETPLIHDSRVILVMVSIGVATMRAQDTSVDAALGRADAALYQAKKQGRNRVAIAASD